MKSFLYISYVFIFSLVTVLFSGCSPVEQKSNTTPSASTDFVTTQTTAPPSTTDILIPSLAATLTLAVTPPSGAIVNRTEEYLKTCSTIVSHVTYSPDSKLLAAACADGIYIFESHNLSQIHKISNGDLRPLVVAFSPNGEIIVSGGNVNLYSVSDGTLLQKLSAQRHGFQSVSISADNQMVAEGTDFFINIWRVSNGALLRSINNHTHTTSIAFAPKGSTLATGMLPNKITLWQASDGTWLRNFVGHRGAINSIAFSPDGKLLASGSDDYTAKLWNVKDGKIIYTLEFTAAVSDIAFSSDGKLLATSSFDDTVRLWQVSTGILLQTLDNLPSVTSVAFSPDGNWLSVGSDNGFIWQWRLLNK